MRAPRIKKEAVETRIRTEEARRVPGTQGDTLKVVQNLPGVGRSAFGSGALIVWGSAPNETRVNVDGVEIPSLYHVGGLRSTINSDLVRSIDLVARLVRRRLRPRPGRPGADRSRAAPEGGHARLRRRRRHGRLGDALDGAHAAPAAGASPGATATSTSCCALVTSRDVGDFVPIPRYDDYQARATLALRPRRGAGGDLPRPPTITCGAPSPRTIPPRCARRTPTAPTSGSSCATRACSPTAPASS